MSQRWLVCFSFALLALSACRPTYPKCEKDAHCADHGEVCVNNSCQQCRDDNQCKPGFECKTGTCTQTTECKAGASCPETQAAKLGEACDAKRSCGEGLNCVEGKCATAFASAAIGCDSTHACPEGMRCEKNVCVNAATTAMAGECLSSRDCPSGKKCEQGRCVDERRCDLGAIPFDYNDFMLSETARAQLDRSAECLRKAKLIVRIEGHCDERGTDEYNLVLGNKRADAVRKYLLGLGVEEGQLQIVSFGREKPRNPAHDEAAWSENRRAEFSVVQ